MTTLAFDTYQFESTHAYPVHAEYQGADDWSSTGISFEDFRRLHIQTAKLSASRSRPVPDWVVNDTLFREKIVGYMEARYLLRPGTGTLRERLDRAQASATARNAKNEANLTCLCRAYVAVKDADPARANKLSTQIKNLDTVVRTTRNCASLAASIAYLYYRAGWNSVQVGDAVGVKPPHVRQIIWRLSNPDRCKPCVRTGGSGRPKGSRNKIRPRKTIQEHLDTLTHLATENGGVLPSWKWLGQNGFGYSYEAVLKAGLLGSFKREILKKGPKRAEPKPVQAKPPKPPKPAPEPKAPKVLTPFAGKHGQVTILEESAALVHIQTGDGDELWYPKDKLKWKAA